MTLDDVKSRLESIDDRVESLEKHIVEALSSITVLQRNSLRMLGAGSLLGGCVIYVLARAAGLS